MSDKNNDQDKKPKTESVKNTASKNAPAKKAAAKKASKTKAVTKNTAKPEAEIPGADKEMLLTIQSMVHEMNNDREHRDKQLSSLISEVKEGFVALSDKTSSLDKSHDDEMSSLYSTLNKAFTTLESDSLDREQRNLGVLEKLTSVIQSDHERTLKEVHEQEKLQDKKLKYIDKLQNQRIGMNRLIAIPAAILAAIGIVYMFNVVRIMEGAMTSMSTDMNKIQVSVSQMTTRIDTMSQNTTVISESTSAMNDNIQHLNNNTSRISQDLNVMTHNVAPTMNSMSKIMPW